MGCGTFCCKLLVRIEPEEARRIYPDQPDRRFMEKGPDGFCEFLDRDTCLCRIWEQRPDICRAYDCNSDELLQVAVNEGIHDLVALVKRAENAWIPPHHRVRIPDIDDG